MRLLGIGLAAVAIGQLAVGARAMAENAPASPPAAPPPSQGPTAPAPSSPPDPYGAPPPVYGAPPPYAAPYYPIPANQMTFIAYESQRKNAGLGVLLEFLIPGLGSLYGDHAVGSLITWTLIIAGIAMMFWGLSKFTDNLDRIDNPGSRDRGTGTFGISVGIALLLGGRIFGFVDSYMAAEEFNRRLRVKLGLPAAISFSVGGVGSGAAMSIGPRLGFTF